MIVDGVGRATGVGVVAAAGSVGVAVTRFARLSSLPPDAPVSSRVVPTETRKMRVYFLVGSCSAESFAVGESGREDPDAAAAGAGSCTEDVGWLILWLKGEVVMERAQAVTSECLR